VALVASLGSSREGGIGRHALDTLRSADRGPEARFGPPEPFLFSNLATQTTNMETENIVPNKVPITLEWWYHLVRHVSLLCPNPKK
jgi:hypothetical protein